MKVTSKFLILFIVALLSIDSSYAQSTDGVLRDGSRQNNVLTAVPFLLIMPQTRLGAMGNAGIAMDGDANSPSINTAAMAFLPEKELGLSISYSPWLKSITPDISLSYFKVPIINSSASGQRTDDPQKEETLPTDYTPVITMQLPREVQTMRWGLIPAFAIVI